MNAIAPKGNYKQIDDITNKYNFVGQNNVSSFKKIICLTSDEEGVTNSKQLLELIANIEASLPVSDDDYEKESTDSDLKVVNSCLHKVNAMFESIEALFKLDNDENKVEIDDAHMYDFLSNMSKAKKKLEYISDYLTLVIDVQESKTNIAKGENTKEYTFEEFIALIDAA